MYQNDIVVNDKSEEINIGIVTGCKKLNIREKPTVEAPVVCEIVCRTELMIDEKESTEEFYKVCTAAGIEGFCMRKFIAIQP
ncbi:MAG: SH3 domain-containing protein [Paludibacter sp.]|nr:SH3 domain-containing protein [Paludibacter sp.]